MDEQLKWCEHFTEHVQRHHVKCNGNPYDFPCFRTGVTLNDDQVRLAMTVLRENVMEEADVAGQRKFRYMETSKFRRMATVADWMLLPLHKFNRGWCFTLIHLCYSLRRGDVG